MLKRSRRWRSAKGYETHGVDSRVSWPTMGDESKEPEPKGPLLGSYANYFEVGHNAFEFLLDFGQFFPENDRARVHTRIIMSPTYAQALFRTLEESLQRYEQTFGSIEDGTNPAAP
jgi:hypothetical protein